MIQNLPKLFRRMAVLASGAALVLTGAAHAQGNLARQSLMVFPIEVAEGVPAGVAEAAHNAVRNAVSASGKYEVGSFYARSPLVIRAIQTNLITREASLGPFTSQSVAPIAKALGAHLAVVGSVEDYSYSDAEHKAAMVLSLQLVSAADGSVLSTAVVSSEIAKPELTDTSAPITVAADVAGKAAAQILGVTIPAGSNNSTLTPVPTNATTPAITGAAPAPRKKSKTKNTLLIVGGVALLAVLLGSGGGGGGNGGGDGDGPPPFPF